MFHYKLTNVRPRMIKTFSRNYFNLKWQHLFQSCSQLTIVDGTIAVCYKCYCVRHYLLNTGFGLSFNPVCGKIKPGDNVVILKNV